MAPVYTLSDGENPFNGPASDQAPPRLRWGYVLIIRPLVIHQACCLHLLILLSRLSC
jgi:hypothetical protein